MSSPPRALPTATVVQLARYRRSASKEVTLPRVAGAKLFSLRQNLDYQGSIEIDDWPWLQSQFSESVRVRVEGKVRNLLNREFGRLRVSSSRGLFVVRHRSVEALVAGLLRVQFHARLIPLPRLNVFEEVVEQQGFSLTWGVGQSANDAEVDRLRRRRRKNCQQ